MAKGSWKPAFGHKDVSEEVAQLAAFLTDSKMSDEEIAERVGNARSSKMSVKTVKNLRELRTKRPHSYTVEWCGWAVGKRLVWQNI